MEKDGHHHLGGPRTRSRRLFPRPPGPSGAGLGRPPVRGSRASRSDTARRARGGLRLAPLAPAGGGAGRRGRAPEREGLARPLFPALDAPPGAPPRVPTISREKPPGCYFFPRMYPGIISFQEYSPEGCFFPGTSSRRLFLSRNTLQDVFLCPSLFRPENCFTYV